MKTNQTVSACKEGVKDLLIELVDMIHRYPMESEADLIDIVYKKYLEKYENN